MSADAMSTKSEEARPLVESSGRVRTPGWITKPVALLLLMKLFSHAFEYQIHAFSIDEFVEANANTTQCTRVPYANRRSVYNTSTMLAAAAVFILPTLGGLISDKYFACLKVLTGGCMVKLWGSVLFALMIRIPLFCHSSFWYYSIGWLVTSVCFGLVDPLLIYALMQFATDCRSRTFLTFVYFIAATGPEYLSSLPSFLRYTLHHSVPSESFEFLGVVYNACFTVCAFHLAGNPTASERLLPSGEFEIPRLRRLRRYYMAVAGFIPYVAAVIISRNIFYGKEVIYYTKDNNGYVSTTVSMLSYQVATMLFCLIGALAVSAGVFPKRLTISVRIRTGLILMLLTRVALFALSFSHARLSELGDTNPLAVRAVYSVAAFADGVANGLTGAATFEMVDCIAERCAKAMYIGIFCTTWGVGLSLVAVIVYFLRWLPSDSVELFPQPGVQPQFYIRYAVGIVLVVLSYAYYALVAHCNLLSPS